MNAKITVVRPGTRGDFRQSPFRFTVYTDGVGRDIADKEYFRKHNIGSLEFHCKSWGRVGGFAAAIEAQHAKDAVEEAFGVKVELHFSRTAGCRCGCSPGFVGKILSDSPFAARRGDIALSRASVWVDVPLTEDEKQSIRDYAAKMAKKLPAEIEAGNAQVAAEKAALEQRRAEEKAARDARDARWDQRRREEEARYAARQADDSLRSADL